MLADDFKEILANYSKEKTKKFKDNPLVLKIRNQLPVNISKILDDSFTVKGACGVNSWPESPWLTIVHNSFDSPHEALIIQYTFDIENKTVLLSVVPRVKNNKDYDSIKRKLVNYMKMHPLDGFDSTPILSKTYQFSELNDFRLKKDLNSLTSTYIQLCNIFNSCLSANQNEITVKQGIMQTARISDVSSLSMNENQYENDINKIAELFSKENIEKIIKTDISIDDYELILNNIKLNSYTALSQLIKSNDISLEELSIKDRILLYSKSFVATEYKSVGQLLGSYSFNKILIDDRLANPLIITSIIHELSHYLLEKILKEILMKILNSNDTPLISSFVKITLENDLNYLVDEYCAHSVEGRFALYGYQDYSSFEFKLNEIADRYSNEDIEYALVIANTFAYSIKELLEDFINEDLREEIKEEFLKLNEQPNYNTLSRETELKLENEDFIDAIAIVLSSGIGESLNQDEKLLRYVDKYYKHN